MSKKPQIHQNPQNRTVSVEQKATVFAAPASNVGENNKEKKKKKKHVAVFYEIKENVGLILAFSVVNRFRVPR